jgi:hypothetical protein
MASARIRGSLWQNNSKKKVYTESLGSYGYSKKGDRFFKLTSKKTEKVREYSSPAAAIVDGWYIVKQGK